MQIVIKLSEKDYQNIRKDFIPYSVIEALCNGTVLTECEDTISRKAALSKKIYTETENGWSGYTVDADYIEHLPPVKPQEQIGYCKDCKWWKDSDGAYRRGIGAESQCPINREEVYEGNGYCYMFKPQESEEV